GKDLRSSSGARNRPASDQTESLAQTRPLDRSLRADSSSTLARMGSDAFGTLSRSLLRSRQGREDESARFHLRPSGLHTAGRLRTATLDARRALASLLVDFSATDFFHVRRLLMAAR